MEQTKMKLGLLPSQYVKESGIFDKEKAINLCGKIAGVCYNKEGFYALMNEPVKITNKRINLTLNMGHHSVYDHILLNFNLENIPKILAMVLNNEKQYTTSEKSARYTPVIRQDGSIITSAEETLYQKWQQIFKDKIRERYGDMYNDSKIEKLAQENSRYLVTVFMPTQMIYSTTFRQINYIASWMKQYIDNAKTEFEKKLSIYMADFIQQLGDLNILEEGFLKNEKQRRVSLFAKDIEKRQEIFSDVYSTIYKGSFAQLAQAQRHRTLDYEFTFLEKKEYYIPPIIEDNKALVEEWLQDISSVADINPQGELVLIHESGKYEDFLLKAKERICSAAQLEIADQTRNTLLKYQKVLEDSNHPLKNDMLKYTKGARCTFPDYTCLSDCKFAEGKTLKRKI